MNYSCTELEETSAGLIESKTKFSLKLVKIYCKRLLSPSVNAFTAYQDPGLMLSRIQFQQFHITRCLLAC